MFYLISNQPTVSTGIPPFIDNVHYDPNEGYLKIGINWKMNSLINFSNGMSVN